MEKKKVAVLGASGYTGSDLLRFLLVHPNVEVTHLTAEKHAGKMISDVFPHLKGFLDLELKPLKPKSIPKDIDIVFAALPHGTSAKVIKELYERDIKIIDLGADFRLSNKNYKKWYGEHPCPELIKKAVYGITELNRHKVKKAKLVANPGCYPTSSILGLAPLLINKIADHASIIIDSKSGVSGAGRSPSLDYHYSEVNEGMKAYKVGEHRHMPEIEEALSNYSGLKVKVSFTPHLIPMDRGILSTIYVNLNKSLTTKKLIDIYNEHYKDERFVRISPENVYPSTNQVRGSNYCDIGVKVNSNNTAVIVSVIDNLVKGASGQAIQNMNVMMGYEETTGLEMSPVFP
ncbi:MAG: N-acetyl-gamma-glutamyl-phosphate reductase [Candidatus Dadabacteria bacterium]|nr:N-acetyl-gamma-glutamyl-phosphate reductase [Candidatus Dadabacteria bacterium]MCZ6685433.1 N-acetyl-gamma-glutamyl-phosphate reductase [Candidatus Dadabacteria bacterium]MCZ6791718.1 N-acetyl-gamma-glutamyl-phosphate reductase [Candidatus Dadabacteria bacterium]